MLPISPSLKSLPCFLPPLRLPSSVSSPHLLYSPLCLLVPLLFPLHSPATWLLILSRLENISHIQVTTAILFGKSSKYFSVFIFLYLTVALSSLNHHFCLSLILLSSKTVYAPGPSSTSLTFFFLSFIGFLPITCPFNSSSMAHSFIQVFTLPCCPNTHLNTDDSESVCSVRNVIQLHMHISRDGQTPLLERLTSPWNELSKMKCHSSFLPCGLHRILTQNKDLRPCLTPPSDSHIGSKSYPILSADFTSAFVTCIPIAVFYTLLSES